MNILTSLDRTSDYSKRQLEVILGAWVLSGLVDRKAAILPWGESEGPKRSPVSAASLVRRRGRAGGGWLAEIGIGLADAAQSGRTVSDPLRQVSGVLDMGVDVAEGAVSLLAPAEWRGLIAALDRLSAALLALKTPAPPTTPTTPSTPGAALSGG